MNSQLSVARFYGGIKFNGEEYIIIPPVNDLVQRKWVEVYCKLGRHKFVELVEQGVSLVEAKEMIKMPKGNVEQLKLDL